MKKMTKICIIASNSEEAWRWAKTQSLEKEQWFFPKDVNDLIFRSNFHVIVIGSSITTPSSIFEKVYNLALERGKINRI